MKTTLEPRTTSSPVVDRRKWFVFLRNGFREIRRGCDIHLFANGYNQDDVVLAGPFDRKGQAEDARRVIAARDWRDPKTDVAMKSRGGKL